MNKTLVRLHPTMWWGLLTHLSAQKHTGLLFMVLNVVQLFICYLFWMCLHSHLEWRGT